jgi:hypothetical protein
MQIIWERIPNESQAWIARTEVGTAKISLTRGYPVSRNFRIQVNGRVIERFVANIDAAKRRAETYLDELARRQS